MSKYIENLEESMQSILKEGIADDLAKLLGIEKDEAAEIASSLSFSQYLELANAVDVEDREAAMDILDYAGPIEEDNKLLDKPTPTLGELAKKHNVPLGELGAQLATGIKIELEHTNDRAIAKEIALDHLNELPDYYDRLKSVEEADNPFTPITPPSEQMPSSTVAQGGEEESDIGRMDVEDLRTGDDIEVIDIDGEPVAVTVKNPRGPGDTLVVQTDKGEEHMVKKQAVSGTPKMESLKQMYEAAMSDTKFDVVLSSDDMESKAAEGVSMKDALRAAEQQLQMFHDIAIQGDGDPDSINVQRTTYRPNVNGAPMRLPEWMIQDEVTRDISYLVIKPAEAIEEKGRWTRIKNSDKKLGQKINRAERIEKKKKLDHVDEEFSNNIVDGEGDRVETPLGAGTVLAVQKTERGDVLARVQLDDYEDADGDTFTFPSLQLKHLVDEADRTRSAQADFLNIKIPVSAKSKNTRTYLPRSIRAILKDHGVEITGKTRVSAADDSIFGGGGVVVRISGLEFPNKGMGMQKLAKDIYDKLNFAGYNVEDYPTFVQSGVNVFVNNWGEEDTPRWNIDEAADKVKPFNKMGYAPKAGSWKKRMHKAQPPENHEKTKKRHKKLHEEGDDWTDGTITIRRIEDKGMGHRVRKMRFEVGPLEVLSQQDRDWQVSQALKGIRQNNRKLQRELKDRIGSWAFEKMPTKDDPTGIVYVPLRKKDMNESDIEMLKLPDDYKPAPKREPHILDKYDWTMYMEQDTLQLMDTFIHKMKSQNVWDKGIELAGGEEELLRSIQTEADSVMEDYRGSGEGIGTSDINHFVRSIFRDLGEDDIWGWDKKDVEEGYGEETHADMVEYWKQSLSSSIVRKGVFTQMYDAANNDIEELNAAIADQAESIADSYHGSGEGIGSSDQNHFIYNIAQQLGIDDVFGWNKPKVMKGDEEMERDKAVRGMKASKAIRAEGLNEGYTECDDCMGTGMTDSLRKCTECDGMGGWYEESIEEELQFFVDPQGQGANVMNNKGEVHDYYDDPHQARQEAERLNNEYGEVEEARNASNTEHSGAKKGKGGYYGRKKDAKSDSNKARRENDKKAVDEDVARIRKLAGIQETASGGATGAGAVAVGAVATGGMQSRNPSIYGQATKPKRKKRKTKEEKSDGIGRDRKE